MTLHDLFIALGYQWRIDGKLVTPSQDDLDEAIDRAKDLLYDEPIPSQLEVGRLIIRRTGDTTFETYLFIGDAND